MVRTDYPSSSLSLGILQGKCIHNCPVIINPVHIDTIMIKEGKYFKDLLFPNIVFNM